MKKTVASLLLITILTMAFSCAEQVEPVVVETTSAEEETTAESSVPAADFGGETITILAMNNSSTNFPYLEILAESENGETINDAVYKRNIYLEDKFKIEIEAMQIKPAGNYGFEVLQKDTISGDNTFDIGLVASLHAFRAMLNGYLTQMDNLPYVDKNSIGWCSYFNDVTSIEGHNYFLAGDMNIGLFAGSGMLYFNKTVAEQYKLENMYELVEEGKFTIDKFAELCKQVTTDIDGDSEYGDNDRVGYRGNAYAFQMFLGGFKETLVKKDENDIPCLNISEGIIDRIVKSIDNLNYKPYILQANLEKVSIPDFKADLSLFLTNPAYSLSMLRDMESDFGLLPMPKYDEQQDSYYSQIHTSWSSATVIPITLPEEEHEKIGMILQEMAYISNKYIRPAFYETMLLGKLTRDNESEKMLDYIFGNIVVDITYLLTDYEGFDFDGMTRSMATTGDNNAASFIASNRERYESVVNSIPKAVREAYKNN